MYASFTSKEHQDTKVACLPHCLRGCLRFSGTERHIEYPRSHNACLSRQPAHRTGLLPKLEMVAAHHLSRGLAGSSQLCMPGTGWLPSNSSRPHFQPEGMGGSAPRSCNLGALKMQQEDHYKLQASLIILGSCNTSAEEAFSLSELCGS